MVIFLRNVNFWSFPYSNRDFTCYKNLLHLRLLNFYNNGCFHKKQRKLDSDFLIKLIQKLYKALKKIS